jgi:hypothetical protein
LFKLFPPAFMAPREKGGGEESAPCDGNVISTLPGTVPYLASFCKIAFCSCVSFIIQRGTEQIRSKRLKRLLVWISIRESLLTKFFPLHNFILLAFNQMHNNVGKAIVVADATP